MSMTTEQYLAFSKLAYHDFDWPTDKNFSISDLLQKHVVEGETTPVLAALSEINDWKLINYQPNTLFGFSGIALQAPDGPNGEPGEIVFAFRGTEPDNGAINFLKDLDTDLSIALGGNGNNQFTDAYDFYSATIATNSHSGVAFTGHSLGGGIAQYLTYKTNEAGHAYTFNAVGIGQTLSNVDSDDYDDSIWDYVNKNDIIGQYGVQLGNTVYMEDMGNYSQNSSTDNAQLALLMAATNAMENDQVANAAGLAMLTAISEFGQGVNNVGQDIFFGAHSLDTFFSPSGTLASPVSGPGAAIGSIVNVLNLGFTVSNWVDDGVEYFAVEILQPVGETAIKLTLASANGAYQVAISIGGVIWNWINFMGETAADIIYGAATAIGGFSDAAFDVAAMLYQTLFGDFQVINGTSASDSLSHPTGISSAIIRGHSGSDSISGTQHDDVLDGGADDDYVSGYTGNDYIYGRTGNDTLVGGLGSDALLGGDGNDFLYGETEDSTYSNYYGYTMDDILDGGAGNDLLAGGGGNDTYKFGIGYGQDVIDDKQRSYNYYSYGSGGELDTLSFLAGIAPENVKVHRRNETDLELSIVGTNDKITILNFFYYNGGLGMGSIEQVTFANGTVWDTATLQQKAQVIIEATRENDPSSTLTGYEGQDDIVYGTSSDNIIFTYNGDDTIYGYGGSDTVVGGFGSDTIQGGNGNDFLYGEFEDSTYTNYYQHTLDDTLDGGAGDDFMSGGAGDDTYIFGRNYGQDIIEDKNRAYWYNSYGSGGALDTLSFLADVAPEDVLVHRRNDTELELSIIGTSDSITVREFFNYYGGAGIGAIEQVVFADGTTWDVNTLLEKARHLYGTNAEDTITGYSYQDNIIHGGAGNDTINESNGNDTLYGEAGDDTLVATTGNDTLDGGVGNDTLEGGTGNDTYVFGHGYGQDVIHDFAYGTYGGHAHGGTDTIQLLEGIAPEDVTMQRTGDNLEITINGTSDKLTVLSYFSSNGYYSIESIEFANGTIWDTTTIRQKAKIVGSAGDDGLYGTGDGHTFDGGAGNDYLQGGTGNDTYLFGLGYGVETIYDSDSTLSNNDTIKLLEGIEPSDVSVQRVGDNLELSIIGTSDKLVVERYFTRYAKYGGYDVGENGNKIEEITFVDGTIWNISTITDIVRHINGTGGDDYLQGLENQNNIISGGDGNDILYAGSLGDEMDGGAGDDSLYGSYGTDVLSGGTGSDILEGAYGNDVYHFNVGSGNDIVYDSDSSEDNQDKIIFGNGIFEEDVILQRNGDNLVFSFVGTTDTLTIEKYFSQYGRQSSHVGIDGNKVELIEFANGPVWNNETIIEKISHIIGTTGGDSLVGIEGQQSKLSGLDGDDILTAASYGDYLDGGAGNDTLNGSYGQDVLRGGTDNDILRGGEGKDTYIFTVGDGHDTIYDGDASFATDTISFLEGIDPTDVVASRSGLDLVLTINGGTDSITVQDYFSGLIQGSTHNYGVGVNKVERIMFADGTTWDTATLEDQLRFINGTSGDDTLTGYETNDVITAGAGNDTVHSGAGGDTVDAGAGNDIVYGEAGNDQLSGGEGNDILNGGVGNDLLDGGVGDDLLIGDEGSDTYIFGLGSGADEIQDFSTNPNEVDVVAIQAGVSPQDVSVQRDGDDLVLTITNTTDSLTIKNYFSPYQDGDPTDYGVGVNKVEQITFTDGTIWNNRTLEHAVNNNGIVDPNITFGTSQSDTLYADQDGQIIYADEGSDTITGSAVSDFLYGEAGNDTIYAGAGNDTLVGGAGNDTLDGGAGNDTYMFEAGFGHDTIVDYDTTSGNTDTITFGAGIDPNDVTMSRVGNNLILTLAAGDSLTVQSYFASAVNGYHKIEQVVFADSTVWDTSYLETAVPPTTEYDNTVTGTEYDDYLYGTSTNDAISGGAGNDTIYSDNGMYDGTGNDLLDGGTGNDTLYGAGGDDTYVFGLGYGQDYLSDELRAGGSQYGEHVDGGYDTLKLLPGVAPEDIIVRRSGMDLILEIAGTTDSMTIAGFFREVNGVYTSSIDRVEFSDSSQTVWSFENLIDKARQIDGTSAGETLYGYEGQANIINAGAGDDTVYGASGNDTIFGGTGNDILQGGYGNDTYVFAPGFGNDTIYDLDPTEGNSDTVQFLEGIYPTDVVATRSGDDLTLSVTGTSDVLTIDQYFSQYTPQGYSAGGINAQKIEVISFADNTTWGIADIIEKVKTIHGTSGDDSLSGYWDQENKIYAGDGNDTLYAASTTGDELYGQAGNDTLYGSSGADLLDGGTGNDRLEGGSGNDTYIFAAGFGSDTVYDIDSTEGNTDIIQFLTGINPTDVVAARNGDDLTLSVTGTSDVLTIDQYFSQYTPQGYNAGGIDAQKVEAISFADGTTWSVNDIKEKVETIHGTSGDDSLSGFGDQENKIYAGDGNDTVYAASATGDELYGEAGNDALYGASGEDLLTGGIGNDTLQGSSGNDTYVFAPGFGSDVIYDIDSTVGNIDTIQFLAGINPTDVVAVRNGDDLILSITGTSDTLTVDQYFSGYTQQGYNAGGIDAQKVEVISFADSTTWSIADIKEKVETIHGTSGDDTLSGYWDQENNIYAGDGNDTVYAASAAGDELYGEAGSDNLYGAGGVDTLDGGTGDDILEGSHGNDTYVFGIGYGQDTIYDNDTTVGNVDIVQFMAGIAPEDVSALRSGDNLELSVAGTGDSLIVERYFSPYPRGSYYTYDVNMNKIEEFHFADNTIWNAATILDKVRFMTGTSGDDTLQGYSDQQNTINAGDGNDTVYAASAAGDELYGEAGNDMLYGASGADILDGGTGDDTLEGSSGNDSYVFGLGYGIDTIYDHDTTQDNTDTVVFKEGIAPEDVLVKRVGNDLELSVINTTDKLTVRNYFSGYPIGSSYYAGEHANKIEVIQFADETTWDIATIFDKARYISGTEGDDTIYGFETSDVITAGAGNDTIYAGSGNDVVDGGEGNDAIYAEVGNNHLIGGLGNDILIGADGNDILEGGAGNDQLEGSTGNDTYVFAAGFGVDTIYDNDNGQGNSLDSIEFGAGIASEDVKARRVGEDLELSILATDDKLTIERYFSPYFKNSSWYTGEGSNRVEEFHFADNTVWQYADILDKVRYIDGTEGDDTLYGIFYDQQNVINAGAGNDMVYASSAQGDKLYGEAGNDSLYGASGADLLDGGTESDILEGSTGDDTYIFGLGYGIDTIYDSDTTQGNIDVIKLQSGIAPEDVHATRNGDNLELHIIGSTDKLIVERYFSPYARGSYYTHDINQNKIEQIVFSDETVWDTAVILDKVRYMNGTENADNISGYSDQQNIISTGAGDDVIYAGSQGDEIDAGDGNDMVYGSEGADLVTGGTGNDVLEGSNGNDTYVFAPGFGIDTIYDNDSGQGSSLDAIEFMAGISPEDVIVRRLSNDDLELSIVGTSDKLTIERFFSNYYRGSSWNTGADSNAIEEVRFADNTVWTIADIKDKARFITGTVSDDYINGFGGQQNIIHAGEGNDTVFAAGSQNDELYGEGGNDSLHGYSLNERFDGGTGNDYMEGNDGDDTYVFGQGYGQDVIYDSSQGQTGGIDKVVFLTGIDPANVTAKRLPNSDLELTFAGSSDKLTIERYFSPYYKNSSWNTGVDSNVVEEFHFADNTVWTAATIKDMVLTIDGTENPDELYGYEGNDTITAGAGNDTVYASSGNDTIYGEAGNDSLYGDDGNDILEGGTGDDYLGGGYSDDIYIFSGAFGSDQVYDYHGNDSAEFDIGQDNLIFEQVGNALQIISAGTSNAVTVDYWYQYTDHQVETVKASDGSTISNTQIEQLIQAMASWSSNNNGMTWSQALGSSPQDVQSIVAQYWTAPTV